MQPHPIQLKFAHQANIVASRVLPETVAAKAGTSQGEPLALRVRDDIDTVLEHIMDAIHSEDLTLAVGSVDLAILVGKAFIGSEPAEGEPYEIVIPVLLASEKGMLEGANPGAGKGPQTPNIPDPTQPLAASPGFSVAPSDSEPHGGPEDPGMGDPGKPLEASPKFSASSEADVHTGPSDPGMPDPNPPHNVQNVPITHEKPEAAPSAAE